MIETYANENGRLRRNTELPASFDNIVWVDLINPSKEEEQLVESALGIDVPTREEMEEIEISSRLYYEESVAFMTATLPSNTDTDEPLLAPVTFVLTDRQLVTVRYHEPSAFRKIPLRSAKLSPRGEDGSLVLIMLLEQQVDLLADVLERAGREIHGISRQVFQHRGARPGTTSNFQSIIEAIGRKGDLTSNLLECLVSLERMFGFLSHAVQQRRHVESFRVRIKTLSRDCRSLVEYAGTLTNKITFLLDATLGLINIEQNAIIKIFSVAAVAFMPPTLIASIYGMNFDFMPELDWLLGYPLALALMVTAAIVPYLFFKRKGWL